MKSSGGAEEQYIESCRKSFWQKIFQLESRYLVERLKGCRDVLSVGCGPAIVEGELAKHGFNVTGLDVSQNTLDSAPDEIRTVAARAEDMPFPDNSFDAVIYVVSLQFIDDYHAAVEKSASVSRPGGRIIVMLLNPSSAFFKDKFSDPDSYVSKIKHTDLKAIEDAVSAVYSVRGEYFLNISGGEASAVGDKADAALYIISGTKKSKPGGDPK